MNLKFWKKEKPVEGDDAGTPEASDPLARLKALIAGLTARFRSPPPFTAEAPASAEQGSPATEDASTEPDAATETERQGALAGLKLRLLALFQKPGPPQEDGESCEAPPVWRVNLIVAAVLLLLLLLGAFGYAAWSIVRSAPDPKTDVTELITDRQKPRPIIMPASAPAAASGAQATSAPAETDAASAVPAADAHAEQAASSVMAAPTSRKPLTELEMLRQKNAELQAQIDAMKKAQQSSTSVKMYPGNDKGAAAGGVATVGNSDPKATAATLKEAIDAMNAGTNYREKPAK